MTAIVPMGQETVFCRQWLSFSLCETLSNGFSISFYPKAVFILAWISHQLFYHVRPYMKRSDIRFREYIVALRFRSITLGRRASRRKCP